MFVQSNKSDAAYSYLSQTYFLYSRSNGISYTPGRKYSASKECQETRTLYCIDKHQCALAQQVWVLMLEHSTESESVGGCATANL